MYAHSDHTKSHDVTTIHVLTDIIPPPPKFQNKSTYRIIRQWDVNKLVQPPWSQDGWVNDIWTVSGSNDEHILLATHTIHFC